MYELWDTLNSSAIGDRIIPKTRSHPELYLTELNRAYFAYDTVAEFIRRSGNRKEPPSPKMILLQRPLGTNTWSLFVEKIEKSYPDYGSATSAFTRTTRQRAQLALDPVQVRHRNIYEFSSETARVVTYNLLEDECTKWYMMSKRTYLLKDRQSKLRARNEI